MSSSPKSWVDMSCPESISWFVGKWWTSPPPPVIEFLFSSREKTFDVPELKSYRKCFISKRTNHVLKKKIAYCIYEGIEEFRKDIQNTWLIFHILLAVFMNCTHIYLRIKKINENYCYWPCVKCFFLLFRKKGRLSELYFFVPASLLYMQLK